MSKRVVITGMSAITSLGDNWSDISRQMQSGNSGVKKLDDWDQYEGLNTRLAGPVTEFRLPKHYTRKKIRAMGRVAQFSTRATELALIDAALLDNPVITNGHTGIAYGSCSGSSAPMVAFGDLLKDKTTRGINATTYIKLMSHTTAVNTALFFSIKGRVIPTSTACTSGSQAVGYAYEAIKFGLQKVMVAGGAEELCPTQAAVFDTLYATSLKNDSPGSTPRPFDKARDGLVIGEGGSTLILEELEHAKARGANIYAEILGFGTNCDAEHVTQPTSATMQTAMELALTSAELSPESIGYISAHGTATERGDIAESQATYNLFGNKVPFSSMKGYFGHTLGACGALESLLAIKMMNEGRFAPTHNLEQADPACAALDYIKGGYRDINTPYVMSNNFAFGGINTSLILAKYLD